MEAPPNRGGEDQRDFNRLYPALARRSGLALYPFFLEGMAMDPELDQPDGLHLDPRRGGAIAGRSEPVAAGLTGDVS
jgi:acyl-CoA thioesterase-1